MIKENNIIDMYIHLRETNNSIPDEALDFMKRTCIEKLNQLEKDKKHICKNCKYWYSTGSNYYCHLYSKHKFFHQTCDEFRLSK